MQKDGLLSYEPYCNNIPRNSLDKGQPSLVMTDKKIWMCTTWGADQSQISTNIRELWDPGLWSTMLKPEKLGLKTNLSQGKTKTHHHLVTTILILVLLMRHWRVQGELNLSVLLKVQCYIYFWIEYNLLLESDFWQMWGNLSPPPPLFLFDCCSYWMHF